MDRIEDWPAHIVNALGHDIPSATGIDEDQRIWQYSIIALSNPLIEPRNAEVYREAKAAVNEQLLDAVMVTNQHPDHTFELIGIKAPAEGFGPIDLRAPGGIIVPLAVRIMRAYVRGTPVHAEVVWIDGDTGIDRIVKPRYERQPRKMKDVRAAITGLHVLLSIPKRGGGRHATPWQVKVDKLAEAGLRWLSVKTDAKQYASVEDCGRTELGESTRRGTKGVNDHMNREPKVFNEDVWRRMHELLKRRNSE